MADNVNVTAGVGTPIAADDISSVWYQRIKRSVGADGSATDYLDKSSRSDTFTGTGSGTTVDVNAQAMSSFSMSVKGTGAAPTSWTVNLQISLDGTNWTTIMVHSNTSPPADEVRADGQTISTGANRYVAHYFRTNVSALVLGGASNIVVQISGKP
jgi:hypothetical protein